MTELITDKQKFRILMEDPTLKREKALQRTLRETDKKNIFSDFEYSNLFPKGSKPARLYGNLKYTRLSDQVLFVLFSYCLFNWYL